MSCTVTPTTDLLQSGSHKILWASDHMPVLQRISKLFRESQPLKSLKVAMSIHMEAKTAYLADVLKSAGAEVHATGSNVLSTQDDVACALSSLGVTVNAIHGVDQSTYFQHLRTTLSCHPNIVIDDGGDLIDLLANDCSSFADELIGGCEETTTGILRLKAREKSGTLPCPMFAVNDAKCKHYYDNKYGTGQSVLTAIMQTTNLILAGKTVVVAGYGWCGKGVAMRAAGMGANVIITEVDPFKALDATMQGFRVMPMEEAAPLGDVFITVTGCKDVITMKHFELMKDGAILCNAGHFDCEVSMKDLDTYSIIDPVEVRKNIHMYEIYPKRMNADPIHLYVLGEGRLVNLAAGDGHPAEIMDMSFAVQALTVLHIVQNQASLKDKKLYLVPDYIDDNIGRIKLSTLGLNIDHLTEDQEFYLNGCIK